MHEIYVLIAWSSNEDLGEPAQICRLTRAFAAHMDSYLGPKFRSLPSLDMSAWAFKGGFCAYVVSTITLCAGPNMISCDLFVAIATYTDDPRS